MYRYCLVVGPTLIVKGILKKKGLLMFTAEQYRAKAREYSRLLRMADDPDAAREFQKLERSYTELADNAEWVTDNHGKAVHAVEDATAPFTPGPPAQDIA